MKTPKNPKPLCIALPLESRSVSSDVANCPMFVRYEIDPTTKQVTRITILETPPPTIEERVCWLSERQVDMLLFSGINPALNELCFRCGLTVISGFQSEEPKEAIQHYLKIRQYDSKSE